MNRNTLLGAIAVLVIIGGVVWYGATRPSAPQSPQAGNVASSTLPAVSPLTESGKYYTVAVNFPTTTPLSATENQAALRTMHTWIATQVADFKTQGRFDALTPKDIQMMGYDQGRKQSLAIKYLVSSSKHTVSYIYTEYLDTLGAHGNIFFRTFTFDNRSGSLLSLSDVFGGDYLAKLSTRTRTELAKSLGQFAVTATINSGTTPTSQSFQNWFFDNGTLYLLFAPYDVAAYAAGPQTVRIPVSDLAGVLKPAYQ